MATGLLLRNMSSDDPDFEVSNLSARNSLAVSVRAFNRKGFSEAVTLTMSLLKYPQRHTAQVPVKVELTTVLIIILGAVGLIAAMSVVFAAVFFYKFFNNKDSKDEQDKRQQDETANIPLTSTKTSESMDSMDKNPDIIPLDGKISDNFSDISSTTDYHSKRPHISNTRDKCDISNCNRFYDHNISSCGQYIQVQPMEYRRQYPPSVAPVPNLGPSIQILGPMNNLHVPNDCQRHKCDQIYQDRLKYKNILPLNTNSLLPTEQLMPPERQMSRGLYAAPAQQSLYSNPNKNPLNMNQLSEFTRQHLEPRSLAADARNFSNSPPVRFKAENNIVYFSKNLLDRSCNTLPRLKSRLNDISTP